MIEKLPIAIHIISHKDFLDREEYNNEIYATFSKDLNDYLSRGINIPVFCQLCKIQPGLIVKKYLSLPFLRKMCYNDNGIFCNRRKLL